MLTFTRPRVLLILGAVISAAAYTTAFEPPAGAVKRPRTEGDPSYRGVKPKQSRKRAGRNLRGNPVENQRTLYSTLSQRALNNAESTRKLSETTTSLKGAPELSQAFKDLAAGYELLVQICETNTDEPTLRDLFNTLVEVDRKFRLCMWAISADVCSRRSVEIGEGELANRFSEIGSEFRETLKLPNGSNDPLLSLQEKCTVTTNEFLRKQGIFKDRQRSEAAEGLIELISSSKTNVTSGTIDSSLEGTS
jgi:hypothetical protein